MTEQRIQLTFDAHGRRFRPAEILSGAYCVQGVAPDEVEAIELSVLWYTEGKGDEDLAVHLFKRFAAASGDLIDPCRPGRFSTQLPNSPLSYEGVIIKVRWLVRVRAFLSHGKEIVEDHPFHLGHVHSARAVLS